MIVGEGSADYERRVRETIAARRPGPVGPSPPGGSQVNRSRPRCGRAISLSFRASPPPTARSTASRTCSSRRSPWSCRSWRPACRASRNWSATARPAFSSTSAIRRIWPRRWCGVRRTWPTCDGSPPPVDTGRAHVRHLAHHLEPRAALRGGNRARARTVSYSDLLGHGQGLQVRCRRLTDDVSLITESCGARRLSPGLCASVLECVPLNPQLSTACSRRSAGMRVVAAERYSEWENVVLKLYPRLPAGLGESVGQSSCSSPACA